MPAMQQPARTLSSKPKRSRAEMKATVKLPKSQQDLLSAMEGGVTCFYMRYMGRFNPTPYYFRSDTNRRCTAAALALLGKGLVEKFDVLVGDHKLRIKK
jgi:hypothetical protein